MEFLKELLGLFTNEILLVPAFAWFVAQLLKTLINGIVNKSFSPERLFGDGGMPSGHSATVMALAMMCGFSCGFGSGTHRAKCEMAKRTSVQGVGV